MRDMIQQVTGFSNGTTGLSRSVKAKKKPHILRHYDGWACVALDVKKLEPPMVFYVGISPEDAYFGLLRKLGRA